MKRNILITISLIILSICSASAQTQLAHEWKVTLKVIDDNGQAVPGAETWVNYLTNRFTGLTDSNGVFIASHTDQSVQLAFHTEKSGYYSYWTQYQLGFNYDFGKWNPNVNLVLKKIETPIPMYAKWVSSEPHAFKKTGRPPIIFDGSIGYDLMVGDWVAPDGKGQSADMIFTEHFSKQSTSDYEYKLIVSFPKVGDGIEEFTVPDLEKGSDLRSPHEAPADGYQSQLTREDYSHPGQPGKSDYDPNRNYFFRVHTILDSNGNVKSAQYGKIYGDLMQMNFRYYLNPTPNDRNIEFDPKQNLLGGLQSFEQVSAP